MSEDRSVLSFADRSARAALIGEHRSVLLLCLEWERLADMLPRLPGAAQWANLKLGFAAFRDVHLVRIDRVTAEIASSEAASGRLLDFASRLRAFNLADSDHSRDVEAAFDALQGQSTATQAEHLGYMLRCLFDGCRRTILAREILLSALIAPR